MKPDFSRQIFEKYSDVKFHDNPFKVSRIPSKRTASQTYTTKLTVPFRSLSLLSPTLGDEHFPNLHRRVVPFRIGTAHGVEGTATGFPETSFRSYRISRTFELLVRVMWATLLNTNEHTDVAHGVPQRNMRGVIRIDTIIIYSNAASLAHDV
jgi:hypothetical protein